MHNSWIEDKLADFQFWWARKTLKKDTDYKLHDTPMMEMEILRGRFKGVKIWFDDVILNEEGLVDFCTVILENPNNLDVCTKKFVKLSTNLFRITLSEFVAKPKNIDKVINESRTSDTDELDQEREFHEENSPLLEARILKRESRKKVVPADSGVHPEIQQPTKSKRTRARVTGKKRPNRK